MKKYTVLAIMLFLCCLSGCERVEAPEETGSVEKGYLIVKQQENSEYPALKEQESIVVEGADNPAGYLQENGSNVMVQIHAGNLKGSGVIIASSQTAVWIATAGHVLDAMENTARITFMDGFEVETDAVQRLDTQDIGILKVSRSLLVEETEEGKDDHGIGYRRAILSKEAFEQAGVGDLIIAMGSRSGVGEEAYAGTILQDYVYLEDFGANMMVAEVVATPGMSGGGLFDTQGRLLGIICGVSEEGEVAVSSIMSILAMDFPMN